ncbi:MAG: twin-arginine translocase TatA/TatE family subunit [Myxococcaceae bacterium]|jgi:TatA/E family protein of Tat protein translocase|nr:twin-arginine translocase TatA/TatE family subunit [Myxococcaceae bacterium]MCA3012011.1 twin-arginine translocase TatA/TatE family subunit [Myxococcaceae bacterium]
MGLKGTEILLLVLVVVLLFGASRLPQLGSSIGSFVKNLKKGLSGEAEAEDKKLAESTGQQVQASDKAAQKQS